MLKQLWTDFTNFISDLWNIESSDMIDVIFSKITAMLIVFICSMTVVLAIAILGIFVTHPYLFLYVGIPIIAIYILTKILATYGAKPKNELCDEYLK